VKIPAALVALGRSLSRRMEKGRTRIGDVVVIKTVLAAPIDWIALTYPTAATP